MDVDARPGKVEFVGEACGQKIAVVGQVGLKLAQTGLGKRLPAVHLIEKIVAHARPGIDADPPAISIGHVTGRFECLPSTFEQQPLLGIKQGGFTGAVAKKFGIKAGNVGQNRPGLDIVRIIAQRQITFF